MMWQKCQIFVPSPISAPPSTIAVGCAKYGGASVDNVSHLTAEVESAVDRFTAAGIRKTWVFQAFDDNHEVLILQEFADEESARHWIEHPDAAAQWMSGIGMGAYPPLFVGRFLDIMRVNPE